MLLDIFIVLILVLFTLLGIRDGFFKKVFGILGAWGGFVLATKYMGYPAGVIASWLTIEEDTAHIVSFSIILIAFLVAVNLGYRWFGQTGKETLSPKSRITGGVLGFCQGLVAVSLILLSMAVFDSPEQRTRNDSALYYSMITVAPAVFDYSLSWMPTQKEFVDELKNNFKHFSLPE